MRLITIFIFACLTAIVLAGARVKQQKPPARSLDVTKGPHTIMINGKKLSATGVHSRLQFLFTTNGFPRFRARYFRRSDDADTAAFFAFRTALVRVVEFVDAGNDGFDGTDDIISQLHVDNIPAALWSALSQTDISTGDASIQAHSWETSVTGPKNSRFPDVTLTLRLYISSDLYHHAVINQTLGPNDLKFDVEIDNYQYHANNTRVALVFAVDSRSGRRLVDNNDDISDPDADVTNRLVIGDSNTDNGHFGWVSNLRAQFANSPLFVDTDIIPVVIKSETMLFSGNASLSEADDDDDSVKSGVETRSFISFTVRSDDQPTSIHWDPSTVVNDDALDADSSSAVTTLASAVTVLAVLAGLF